MAETTDIHHQKRCMFEMYKEIRGLLLDPCMFFNLHCKLVVFFSEQTTKQK